MKYTKEQVKQDNDKLRKSLANTSRSRVVLTPGVRESDNQSEILEAIRSFDSFSGDNDPHGEHDFATVKVGGESYMFKIDYYDLNTEYGVDPTEEDCIRVLTIMHASEY
jgi:hypothetical protein